MTTPESISAYHRPCRPSPSAAAGAGWAFAGFVTTVGLTIAALALQSALFPAIIAVELAIYISLRRAAYGVAFIAGLLAGLFGEWAALLYAIAHANWTF